MYLRESSSDLSANRNVCDDPAIQNRRRQRSHEAGAAVDTISASSSWDTVSDANDDDSDDRILHTQFSIGSSNDWRHQHDDVVTPVRHVTSDVAGIPLRHSTPIISRPHDVIGRTPANVSAPDLSGIDISIIFNIILSVCASSLCILTWDTWSLTTGGGGHLPLA